MGARVYLNFNNLYTCGRTQNIISKSSLRASRDRKIKIHPSIMHRGSYMVSCEENSYGFPCVCCFSNFLNQRSNKGAQKISIKFYIVEEISSKLGSVARPP